MRTVTKTELINMTHGKVSGINKLAVNMIVNSVFDTIMETVANGDKVTITGFGSFEPATRAEREGRNPQTGETMLIPEKTVPKFKAGKVFKDAVEQASAPF